MAVQENCSYVNAAAKAHGRSAAHFPMKSRDSMQMKVSEPDDNARPRRHTSTTPLKAPNVSSHTSGASKPPSLWGGFHFNVTYFNTDTNISTPWTYQPIRSVNVCAGALPSKLQPSLATDDERVIMK